MLVAYGTPIIEAMLVLISLLVTWWLVVDWGFRKPARTANQSKHQNTAHPSAGRLDAHQPGQDHTDRDRTDHNRIGRNRNDQARPDQKQPENSSKTDQSSKQLTDTSSSAPTTPDSVAPENSAPTQVPENNSGKRSPKTSSVTVAGSTTSGSKNGRSQPPIGSDLNDVVPDTTAPSKSGPTPKAELKTSPDAAQGKSRKDNTQASGAIKAVDSKNRDTVNAPRTASASAAGNTKEADGHQKSSESSHAGRQHQKTVSIGSSDTPSKIQQVTSGTTSKTATDRPVVKDTQRQGVANNKLTPAQKPKYQTAAKTQSPSVRSEASIQIQTNKASVENSKANDPQQANLKSNADKTDTLSTNKDSKGSATSDDEKNLAAGVNKSDASAATKNSALARTGNYPTAAKNSSVQNVDAVTVAATHKTQPSHSAKLKSVPNSPVALHPAAGPVKNTDTSKGKWNQRKQSPIERAMSQQINENELKTAQDSAGISQTNLADATDPEKPASAESQSEELPAGAKQQAAPEDTALRAQLANSEKRIKSLQSTLNNLQQNQSQSAAQTPNQATSQNVPHNRPGLLSKVRILDAPRG